MVLVSGCHIGDCHYINANHWTERRIKRIWKKMEKLGLRTERLGLEWISAAEGLRFQQVMERMEKIRRASLPRRSPRRAHPEGTKDPSKKQGVSRCKRFLTYFNEMLK